MRGIGSNPSRYGEDNIRDLCHKAKRAAPGIIPRFDLFNQEEVDILRRSMAEIAPERPYQWTCVFPPHRGEHIPEKPSPKPTEGI